MCIRQTPARYSATPSVTATLPILKLKTCTSSSWRARSRGEGLKKQAEAEEKGPSAEFAYAAVDPERAYGFVAVAAGEGLKAVFTDLGADAVVSGGQTMNPATADILAAVQSVPAKTVFVLPNNKNIIMAAEQAQKLADRAVVVLPHAHHSAGHHRHAEL